jgi:hypothetical protein
MADVGRSERVEIHDTRIVLGLDPGGLEVDRQDFGRALRHPRDDGLPLSHTY